MNVYEVLPLAERITRNPYVGRGIVIGRTPDGTKAAVAYFIMGRSENSRNRVFSVKGNEVFTEPYDASLVSDPSLIIYRAISTVGNRLIVTNGDQTDTIRQALTAGKSFRDALSCRTFEPDAPNFTPRISGMLTFADNSFSYEMSILKSIDEEGSGCARYTFEYPSKPGMGHFIHTYVTDGNPLPTFLGEPERVRIPDDIDGLTEELWSNLDGDNRISLYVRYTDISGEMTAQRLINRNGI